MTIADIKEFLDNDEIVKEMRKEPEYKINQIIVQAKMRAIERQWEQDKKELMDMLDLVKEDLNDEEIETEEELTEEEDVIEMENETLITLNIDTTQYNHKPVECAWEIQKRLGNATKTYDVEDIAELVGNGASFKCAELKGGSANVNWVSQQLFAIDMDNDKIEKHGMMTPELALDRCNKYGIAPAFYYYSFSNKEELPKFRLVFICDIKIEDKRVRNAIQMALMTIFPECDSKCKDASRLFFGGKGGPVAIDYNNRINPFNLINSMVAYIKDTDTNGHANRDIKKYCQSIGLNMINGYPNIKILEDSNFGENSLSSILYYRGYPLFAKNIIFEFSIEKEEAFIGANGGKSPKYKVGNMKIDVGTQIQNFRFDELADKCKLFNGFVSGEHWCFHEEAFHIGCNLWNVKGIKSIFEKAIDDNDDYKDKANKKNILCSCSKGGYAPTRCDSDNCKYYNECPNNGLNILTAVDNKRSNIRLLGENVLRKDLRDAEIELQDALHEVYEAEDNNIYIIKAPTGIGKTTALKGLSSFNNLCIAYPNHKLGEDIVDGLKDYTKKYLHVKEIQIEDDKVLEEYKTLQSIGAYKQARNHLENHAIEIVSRTEKDTEERKKAQRECRKIYDYLDAIDECRATNKTLFCTHKRAMDLNNKNINTFIFDEDVVKSSCIITKKLNSSSIAKILDMAIKCNCKTVQGTIESLLECIKEAEKKPHTVVEMPARLVKEKELNTIIGTYKEELKKDELNIKEIAKIQRITRDDKGNVTGANILELPNKKCIILSATANKTIYEGLFPNREVEFIDLGLVETQGEVILHYDSCSRTKLSNSFERIANKIKTEAPGIENIITFERFEDKFKKEGFNPICHYGKCSGFDEYKGQELIVVGTPHCNESLYLLVASSISKNVCIQQKIEYTNVSRNGYEFYISTYGDGQTPTDNLLREIQFYFIESELEQAIGRARVLRTSAKVHVFSNFPPNGCTLYK